MPIKVALEDNSPEFIENAKYAVDSVKSLFSSIGDSIAEVWTNGSGGEILGNILEIQTNINNTVTNLHRNFVEAWQENKAGQRII